MRVAGTPSSVGRAGGGRSSGRGQHLDQQEGLVALQDGEVGPQRLAVFGDHAPERLGHGLPLGQHVVGHLQGLGQDEPHPGPVEGRVAAPLLPLLVGEPEGAGVVGS